MTAQVIVLANQKGGCGKTSAALCLAGELGSRGNRTLVVDADAQQTAVAWSRAAPDEHPFPAAVIGMSSFAEKLHREVQRQLENYDFIVIDLPPSVEAAAPAAALLIADLAIVPLPPSPADLWAAQSIFTMIRRLSDVNKEMKTVILATKVQRTAIAKAVLEKMRNFGFPLLEARLSSRTAYQEAVVSGCTVAALRRSAQAAAMEVTALTDEVLVILGGEK